MRSIRTRAGFTIIELLIVVVVIGILAGAGLAKYQNFAESSRRKTCLFQLKTLETGMAVWETTNTAFAENSKCAWGFTTRTGKLTDTSLGVAAANILPVGSAGAVPNIADVMSTVGGAPAFYNNPNSGPLSSVIRDDNVWVCPSALARYYGGEIQNVPDDYLDISGAGVSPPAHAASAVGQGGRYLACVGGLLEHNGGFPTGWISGTASLVTATNPSPCPQIPFKIVLCGSYGSFGPGASVSTPGTNVSNQGGPVGPDGSSLSRHATRW
ncbi:MAG: prepilin-type N-terminal cleavage/methylation domain-containing protein [Candidatus Wallbacteria bacterium]|nr:prepilin-type N-terminal cleavage/methylation domain-containing protein [Candidatus Wallbacteria bacterium]